MSKSQEEKPTGEPLPHVARRGRSSLWWTLSICAIVLGYGLYTRWQWQKTQHPLQLSVLQLPQSGDEIGAPFLKIHIKGAPVLTGDYFVQGPQWQVHLNRLQWRQDAASPWMDASPELRARMEEDLARNAQNKAVADGIEARWEGQYWLPPGEHRIEGQFSATFYDDNEQNWDGSVQIGQSVTMPTPGPTATPTPPPVIGGIADIQYYSEGTASGGGSIVETIDPSHATRDSRGSPLWKSVPRRGQKGFPLTLEANAWVRFRGVQKGNPPSRDGLDPYADAFKPLQLLWKSNFNVPNDHADWYDVKLNASSLPPGSLQSIDVYLVDDKINVTAQDSPQTAHIKGIVHDTVFVRIAPAVTPQ